MSSSSREDSIVTLGGSGMVSETSLTGGTPRVDRGGGVGMVITGSLTGIVTILDIASTTAGGAGARFFRIDFGCGGDMAGFGTLVATTALGGSFCRGVGGDAVDGVPGADRCDEGLAGLRTFTRSKMASNES